MAARPRRIRPPGAVISLAQSTATFHLASGVALFVAWLAWSALSIVGVVLGVVD